MERIEISSKTIDLMAIVRRVSSDRVLVELTEGQVPLVQIVPVEQPHSMAELDRALRATPRLADDANSFAADVLADRQTRPGS